MGLRLNESRCGFIKTFLMLHEKRESDESQIRCEWRMLFSLLTSWKKYEKTLESMNDSCWKIEVRKTVRKCLDFKVYKYLLNAIILKFWMTEINSFYYRNDSVIQFTLH